jgi:hypothetical protein
MTNVDEIEAVRGAKRRALAIADERSKENVALRDAIHNAVALIERGAGKAEVIARLTEATGGITPPRKRATVI